MTDNQRQDSAPWWMTGVVYQIAVPSFADSDGDGMGDVRGIVGKLGYLESLGVDALWLTPVNTTPFRDFGYDVADHRAVDPRFGTFADLEALLEACHARGMRVLLDLALNHTSDEHPWFAESRASRDNARRDWYVWRDGRAPGKPPNRWPAVVEGSAWNYDERTGQYYYHAFLPCQPDLNWRNPAVREEMLTVVRHWLDKGVDGFRLDLINFLFEDERLRDNPFKPGLRPYLAQQHLHDFSQPESLEVAEELRLTADSYGERLLMGEVFTDIRQHTLDYLGDGTNRLHLSFYLDFVRQKWTAAGFKRSVRWLEQHIEPGAWPCYYLDNHDLPRSYSRFGRRHADAKAKVAATLLLTLRGTPIIYYGQELGMRQSRVPRHLLRDPLGKKFWPLHVGRDGARTPMQWSAGPNAGFTEGEPWLPPDPAYPRANVDAEDADPASLLGWYRRLLRVRRQHPALQLGAYRELESPAGVLAYERQAPNERALVLLNFSARPKPLRVSAGEILLSTHRAPGERLSDALQPFEALVATLG